MSGACLSNRDSAIPPPIAKPVSIKAAKALVKVLCLIRQTDGSGIETLMQKRFGPAIRAFVQGTAKLVCAQPWPIVRQEIGRQQWIVQRDAAKVVNE